jgi:transposase-like protein
MVDCPRCKSTSTKKDGVQFGKQRYKCLDCSRSFTEGAQPKGRPKSSPEIDPRVKKVQKILDLLDQLVYPDPPETLAQIKEAIQTLIKK